MLKRFVIGILSVCLVALCCIFSFDKGKSLSDLLSSVENDDAKTIIIDAGHGGFDGGAVASDGTVEKELNLAVALKLDAVLRGIGYKTVLVRDCDTATNDPTDGGKAKVSDIKNRVKLMDRYPNSIFVSIHMNKYSTTQPHGAQVFYSNVEGSQDLAKLLQHSVATHVQADNKRVIKPTTKDIYLLNHATVPSVIVECGFLSNPSDLNHLKSQDYQLKLAVALSYGIIDYLKSDVEIGES